MRSLILVTVLALTSFQALACPDLSGGYFRCRSTTGMVDESRDVIIQQSTETGVTTYKVSATYENDQEREIHTAKADGKNVYKQEPWGDTGSLQITIDNLSCQGKTLVQNHQFTVRGPNGVENYGHFKTVISKSGNQLKMVFTGVTHGQPTEDVVICE